MRHPLRWFAAAWILTATQFAAAQFPASQFTGSQDLTQPPPDTDPLGAPRHIDSRELYEGGNLPGSRANRRFERGAAINPIGEADLDDMPTGIDDIVAPGDDIGVGRRAASTAVPPARRAASARGMTAGTAAVSAVPPDEWRYRWHDNRLWYYHPNHLWSYWDGNRWVTFGPTTTARMQTGPAARSLDSPRYQSGYRGSAQVNPGRANRNQGGAGSNRGAANNRLRTPAAAGGAPGDSLIDDSGPAFESTYKGVDPATGYGAAQRANVPGGTNGGAARGPGANTGGSGTGGAGTAATTGNGVGSANLGGSGSGGGISSGGLGTGGPGSPTGGGSAAGGGGSGTGGSGGAAAGGGAGSSGGGGGAGGSGAGS